MHAPVLTFLVRGADFMLPGAVASDAYQLLAELGCVRVCEILARDTVRHMLADADHMWIRELLSSFDATAARHLLRLAILLSIEII